MHIPRPTSRQPLPAHAKRVFAGHIFDVYQWEQAGYDGKMRVFEKLQRPDTVCVIPVLTDKKILLMQEEQPGKRPFLSIAGGRMEKGEDPLKAAQRELLEETGYRSDEWELVSSVQPYSKIDWAVYTFAAKQCIRVAEQNLDGAEKIELHPVDFQEFMECVLRDEFHDPQLKQRVLEAKLDPKKMNMLRLILGV